MNSLLSVVSGQFGKSFVFGALLPVIVFTVLGWPLTLYFLPSSLGAIESLRELGIEWQIVVATFSVFLIAGLLKSLNIPIIRFYEGYPWSDSWVGVWCIRRAQSDFASVSARWRGMRTLLYAKSMPAILTENKLELLERWRDFGQAVNREFPRTKGSLLPTRLGNVIRSFESYPDSQYGMDAIVIWPRLQGKIDKDYAIIIEDVRIAFDFMLNCSVLSAFLAGMIFLSGIVFPVPLATPRWAMLWIMIITGLIFICYVFYRLAIGRAFHWGEIVKGAFDLYRGDLMRQLGFDRCVATREEERIFWDAISLQMLYGDSPRVEIPRYIPQRRWARCETAGLDLDLLRGIDIDGGSAVLRVTLRVENTDAERIAKGVVLVDFVEDGLEYRWGSEKCSEGVVHVTGSNPYRFTVGDLVAGRSLDVTYEVLGYKADKGG